MDGMPDRREAYSRHSLLCLTFPTSRIRGVLGGLAVNNRFIQNNPAFLQFLLLLLRNPFGRLLVDDQHTVSFLARCVGSELC